MPRRLRLDLFAEDFAHEIMARPIIRRVAAELDLSVSIQVITAKGGSPRVFSELRLLRAGFLKGIRSLPDLIVVLVDGNCQGHAETRRRVEECLGDALKDFVVAGCPDPHIERWYLDDPDAFRRVLGRQPIAVPYKCERLRYKQALVRSIKLSGHTPMLEELEYAEEIVAEMDLYAAGRGDKSLGAFHDGLRAAMQAAARR